MTALTTPPLPTQELSALTAPITPPPLSTQALPTVTAPSTPLVGGVGGASTLAGMVNNTQVGSHAYSADGGHTWVDTGVAFDLTVAHADGTSTTFVQRERPHVVLGATGEPTHLVSGVTWSLAPTLPTSTIVQPIGGASV